MGPVVGEVWLPLENGFPGLFRSTEGLFVLFDFGGLCSSESSQRGVLLSFTISPSQYVAGQVTGLFPYGERERWYVQGYRIVNVVIYCEGVIPMSTVSTCEWYCTVAVQGVVVWLCNF